jgi:hypothetical protein
MVNPTRIREGKPANNFSKNYTVQPVAEPGFESWVFLSNRKRSSKEKNYSSLFII